MTLIFAFGGIAGFSDKADALEKAHRGIALQAVAPQAGQTFEGNVASKSAGLDRIAQALDLIYSKSKANAAKIEALKHHGKVRLVYYPNKGRNYAQLNSENIAYYAPDFRPHGATSPKAKERFVVVINHMGVNWSTAELAAVIVHELSGHARQDLHKRISTSRVLDLECEASLHEEGAYQDMGVDKSSRGMVMFRKQLENHYCSDFRAYMKRTTPAQMALWDTINPDVKALLKHFRAYRKSQYGERDVSLNNR